MIGTLTARAQPIAKCSALCASLAASMGIDDSNAATLIDFPGHTLGSQIGNT
jgi:hypothetical protein